MDFLEPMSREKAQSLNLKRYVPESPCMHGHIGFRETNSGSCLSCRSLNRRGIKTPKVQNPEPMTRNAAKLLGLDRYIPLEPCVNGHTGPRNTSRGYCLACHAATIKKSRNSEGLLKFTVFVMSDAARDAIQTYADQWLEYDRQQKARN